MGARLVRSESTSFEGYLRNLLHPWFRALLPLSRRRTRVKITATVFVNKVADNDHNKLELASVDISRVGVVSFYAVPVDRVAEPLMAVGTAAAEKKKQ